MGTGSANHVKTMKSKHCCTNDCNCELVFTFLLFKGFSQIVCELVLSTSHILLSLPHTRTLFTHTHTRIYTYTSAALIDPVYNNYACVFSVYVVSSHALYAECNNLVYVSCIHTFIFHTFGLYIYICVCVFTYLHMYTLPHPQLIIGDFGLSLDQQKAQMAIWAVFAAVSQ